MIVPPSVPKHEQKDEGNDSSDDEVEIVTTHAYAPPEVYANPTHAHASDLDSEVEVMSFTYDRDDDDSSLILLPPSIVITTMRASIILMLGTKWNCLTHLLEQHSSTPLT